MLSTLENIYFDAHMYNNVKMKFPTNSPSSDQNIGRRPYVYYLFRISSTSSTRIYNKIKIFFHSPLSFPPLRIPPPYTPSSLRSGSASLMNEPVAPITQIVYGYSNIDNFTFIELYSLCWSRIYRYVGALNNLKISKIPKISS